MAPSEEINIPQKPPMVMVDRIVRAEGPVTVTAFKVRGDNVFADNGRLTEPGIIENMAQTAAAGAGITAGATGHPPRTGFIGAIKDLKIFRLPAVGEEIETTVTVEHTVMDATVISAEVRTGQQVIATCGMKIFLVPESGPAEETLFYRNNRELFYSFDRESGFKKKVDFQYSANQEIIRQSWDAAEERLTEVREKVRAGFVSPIAYHMERCLMEIPMLADYMEMPKWRVRRHLRPSVYGRLSGKVLSRYAFVFGIAPSELNNIEIIPQILKENK